ncbi:MAG: hypothetical protein WCX31_15575 [Salinivirgaceae bacterium]|jgi:hypothetical protein
MKTKRLMLISLIMISILTNCKKDDDTVLPVFNLKTSDIIDNLEYKIYESLLTNWDYDTIIIVQQTMKSNSIIIDSGAYESFVNYNNNFDTTIATDFINKNLVNFNLDSELLKIGDTKVIIISQEEYDYYFEGKEISSAWNNFTQKYSIKSIYRLSRVGLNDSSNQALVEFKVHSEFWDSDPNSVIHYLVLEDNKWTSKYNVTIFVE